MGLDTFGARLRFARTNLYSGSGREWAKAVAIDSAKLFQWEGGRSQPRGGLDALTEILARDESVRVRKLDPRALAAWIFTGSGDPPLSGPPPVADPTAALSHAEPATESAAAGSLPPRRQTPHSVVRSILESVSRGELPVDKAMSAILAVLPALLMALLLPRLDSNQESETRNLLPAC